MIVCVRDLTGSIPGADAGEVVELLEVEYAERRKMESFSTRTGTRGWAVKVSRFADRREVLENYS